MERLTTRDQDAALRFLRDAYALRGFDQFVEFMLQTLPALIRSEVTSYNEMELRARRSRNWVIPAQPPERDEGFERVIHEEPVIAHYARKPNSQVVRLSDFLSQRTLRNLALYSEHYRPLGGIEDTLPVIWQAPNGMINAFGLLRHARFSDKELALMEFLRPHLVQAHANAVAFSKIKASETQLQRVLDMTARALVILGRDRTIKFAGTYARDWMKFYFGAAGTTERLPEPLDLWVRQHDAAIHQILELPLPRDPLVVNRENQRLIVRLLSGETELVLLFEEQSTRIHPDSIRSLGLTRRESEVLACLANGHSKAEIARTLGTSRRTVDAQVQHIYQRLEVSSANAAAAKAFHASRINNVAPILRTGS